MPKYNALWAVVEVIDAPDAEAALTKLRARLADAGFTAYDGTPDLVPDSYKLAFLSENQG
jgi:hypothetical protein